MVWVRIFWWVLWRSVVSGAISGAAYGAFLALILGAVFGFVFGAVLGLIIGIVNGLALTIMARKSFSSQQAPPIQKAVVRRVVICTFLSSFIATNLLFAGVAAFTIVPTIIATIVLAYIVRGFPAFVENEFWEREHTEAVSPRKAQIVW